MGKRKNLKADKPQYTGRILFDGNLQVKLLTGEVKTLRTDLGGLALQKADPNKELLVMMNRYVGFDEIHTGYIVRMKQYDDCEKPCFGLKHEPDAGNWTMLNYCDVIAWGYADGGLNDPTLFYSCQSTVAEEIDRERRRAEKGIKTHAEKLAEMEDENDNFIPTPHGLTFRFRHKDDEIENCTTWTKDMGPVPEGFQEKLKATLQDFLDFTKEHPEFKEMHFYTDTTEWNSDHEELDDEEDAN